MYMHMFTCDKLKHTRRDPPPTVLFPLGTKQQMDTPSYHPGIAVCIYWHHLRKKCNYKKNPYAYLCLLMVEFHIRMYMQYTYIYAYMSE